MSTPKPHRSALLAALNQTMRDTSGQGVLFSQAVAERVGINSTDLECLDYILRGPLTAGDLAAATGLTSGAITGVIDRLELAGFAKRERVPDDRRKVMVRVLPAVERRLAPLFAPMEQAAMAALSHYTDKELAFLLEFLTRLRDAGAAAMAQLQAQPTAAAPSPRKTRASKP